MYPENGPGVQLSTTSANSGFMLTGLEQDARISLASSARRANCGVPWQGKNVEPWRFWVYLILPASLDLHQPAKDTGYDTFSACAPSFGVDDRLAVEGISTWRSAAWRVLPGLPSRDWHAGLQKPPDDLWFVRGGAKAGLRPELVRGRQDPHSRWWTWNKNNLLATRFDSNTCTRNIV